MTNDDKQFIADYRHDTEQLKKLSAMDTPTVKESAPDMSELVARIAELEAQVASLMAVIAPFSGAADDDHVQTLHDEDQLLVTHAEKELVGIWYDQANKITLDVFHLRAAKAAYDAVKNLSS